MLEEQGRNLIKDSLKKILWFTAVHIKNIGKSAGQKITKNISETGKKSVKNLVKKGRDLELSEVIDNKDQLKAICRQCKKQGMAFAIKKEKDGGFRILYQRKDSPLVKNAVENVLKNKLNSSKKSSIVDILSRNKNISQSQQPIKAPVKHREVNAR